jgi:glycosyltransferase involved in cell wall biosynthesis
MPSVHKSPDFSIVLPCLNEAETLGEVISEAKRYLVNSRLSADIIVADNGSQDGSQEIARKLGATVVDVPIKGYGSAVRRGIQACKSNRVIISDADQSYSLEDLTPFLVKLDQGFDLVMGNRFAGGIYPGAMPWLHQYIGNPILSWIGRLFFKSKVNDFHSGLRGINRESIINLDLTSNGFEYASEMVVKASLHKLQVSEVPIILRPDGRTRRPHLRTWRDGWRHLIYLLAASPRWLFLYPGLLLFITGAMGSTFTAVGYFHIQSLKLGLNTYLISIGMVITGLQILLMSILARIYLIQAKLLLESKSTTWFHRSFTLDRGIISGIISIFIAFVCLGFLVFNWSENGFNDLYPDTSLRLSGAFVLFFSVGLQVISASFLASILQEY